MKAEDGTEDDDEEESTTIVSITAVGGSGGSGGDGDKGNNGAGKKPKEGACNSKKEEETEEGEDEVFEEEISLYKRTGYLNATDSIRVRVIKFEGVRAIEIARYKQGEKQGMGAVLNEHAFRVLTRSRERMEELQVIQNLNIPGWSSTIHLSYDWFVSVNTHEGFPGVNIRRHFVSDNLELIPRKIGIYLRPHEIQGVFNAIRKIESIDAEMAGCQEDIHNGQQEFLECRGCNWLDMEKNKKRK